MDTITEFLINVFESLGLYSTNRGLGSLLKGMDKTCNGYTGDVIYNWVFLCWFFINTAIMVNYYRGIFNRPPFNKITWWLVNMLAGAVLLLFIAYFYANGAYGEKHCASLTITAGDCWGFGFAAAIISFLWCVLLSLVLKIVSTVNKKIPF